MIGSGAPAGGEQAESAGDVGHADTQRPIVGTSGSDDKSQWPQSLVLQERQPMPVRERDP